MVDTKRCKVNAQTDHRRRGGYRHTQSHEHRVQEPREGTVTALHLRAGTERRSKGFQRKGTA